MEDKNWMTVKEAANVLQIPFWRIQYALATQKIGHRQNPRDRRQYLVDVNELRELLAPKEANT